MTDITFKIQNFKLITKESSSRKASFDLDVSTPDGVMFAISPCFLNQRKDGEYWICGPQTKMNITDRDTGKEKEVWKNHVKFWPEERNHGRMDPLVRQAVGLLKGNNIAPSQPKATTKPKATVTEDDDGSGW